MTLGDEQSRLFRLFVLTLDGVPVAINLLAVRSHCVDLIMNTYDAAYARLSPGTVLIEQQGAAAHAWQVDQIGPDRG
ncbi:GNAT family N-acetyltransferase [Cupriavidus sp. UME77]|uniref:GNAT family N-acetyltransferase n=1 Tax=Cupriavidus sp. UME77 TaxID=1862321 RepID=UPI001602A879